jgi:hypothetical protein
MYAWAQSTGDHWCEGDPKGLHTLLKGKERAKDALDSMGHFPKKDCTL